MKKINYTLFTVHFSLLALLFTSCEKVSPIGVLVSGTGVEDRVKMSHRYYKQHKAEYRVIDATETGDEYTFLVGADSHLTDDRGRMTEMLQIGLDGDDCSMHILAILPTPRLNTISPLSKPSRLPRRCMPRSITRK